MTNYADEIKRAVTAGEMFPFYGFEVNRAGFVCCPLHGEKTPSLRVYPGNRGWRCFGCGAGSSVIDFVMQYFGLSFQAAQEKLNVDFQLGLPIGKQLSRQEQLEAQRKADEQRRKTAKRKNRLDSLQKAYDNALTEFVRLDTIKRTKVPQRPSDGFTDEFAYALRNIDGAAYRLSEAEYNLYAFRRESA